MITMYIRNIFAHIKYFVCSKYSRKLLILFACILLASFIMVLFYYSKVKLTNDEELAYRNILTMKNMMNDPDSFKLRDCTIIKHINNNAVDYSYTIFKYSGNNAYGGTITDIAIFKNYIFISDYDKLNDYDNDMERKLKASVAYDLSVIKYDSLTDRLKNDKEWNIINIDTNKINRRL